LTLNWISSTLRGEFHHFDQDLSSTHLFHFSWRAYQILQFKLSIRIHR
jgi:hypothetical protein